MRNILVKVYGSLQPAPPGVLENLARSCGQFWGDVQEAFTLDGDLLRIAYEGIYFPLDEVLAVLAPLAESGASGKLDYLDLDAWAIERREFKDGRLLYSRRGLNNVLEFSGH